MNMFKKNPALNELSPEERETSLRVTLTEGLVTDIFNTEFDVPISETQRSPMRMLDVSEEFAVLSMMLVKRVIFIGMPKDEFIKRMSAAHDILNMVASTNAPSTREMQ